MKLLILTIIFIADVLASAPAIASINIIQFPITIPQITTTTRMPTAFSINLPPIIQITLPTTTRATSFKCPTLDGLFANPADCTTFYKCTNGIAVLMNCGAGLGFNTATLTCDFKANIPNCI